MCAPQLKSSMTESFEIISPSASALWTFIPIIGLLFLLAGAFSYFLYSSYNTKVELSSDSISIQGALYSRSVLLERILIHEAKLINLNEDIEYAPKLRTNGIGIPGYQAGWFKLKNGRKALLHVTAKSSVLLLPTLDNYDVLLSVSDAAKLLSQLRSR